MTAGVILTAGIDRSEWKQRREPLLARLDELATVGWRLDISHRATEPRTPVVYDASAFHSIALFAVWEAPSLDAAAAGIAGLEAAGWSPAFPTSRWSIGPRDMDLQEGATDQRHDLGFLAFWDWNEAWHRATAAERRDYDEECDVAFNWDLEHGADILGRFATAANGGWDHVALWEIDNIDLLAQAMAVHEHQRDFMFTTSSHLIGRRIPLLELGA